MVNRIKISPARIRNAFGQVGNGRTRVIFLVTVLSLVANVEFVNIFANLDSGMTLDNALLILVLILLVPVMVVSITVYSVLQSVKNHHMGKSLRDILVSYLCVILSFAGIYYTMSTIGDHNQAVGSYKHYAALADSAGTRRLAQYGEALRWSSNLGAFSGMYKKLWSSPEDYVLRSLGVKEGYGNGSAVPIADLVATARLPMVRVVQFQPQNRVHVLFDCVYFSAITILTVGYGDISPNSGAAKLFVVLEIFTGMFLIVIGINTLNRARRSGDF